MQHILMMIRIICICFLFAPALKAQQLRDTTGYHLLVKADLSHYIPTYFPCYHFDLEFPLMSNFALNLGGGPLSKLAIPARINGVTSLDRSGFVIRPELKYYIRPDHPHNNLLYISADYFYREATFRVVENFMTPNNPGASYADTIRIHHHSRGFTFNLGQLIYFKNWGLDVAVGGGLRFIKNSQTEYLMHDQEFSENKPLNFWREENMLLPRFGSQLKIFYRF